MLRKIQDWVSNSSVSPEYALSIDSNPVLESIFLKNWSNLKIEHAVYPEVDACDLSAFSDNSFDLVFSHQVLEHISKPWLAAQEMTRVLRPGGIGIHTTCAFNPRHGQPNFNDYYRFLKDGLAALFEGVNMLQIQEWGNRQAILYNVGIDDGYGDLGGRRFSEPIGSNNDGLYPWVTWAIFEKMPEASILPQKILDGSDIVLKDSHDIQFVLKNFERKISSRLINRDCDDEVFAAYQLLLKPGHIVFDVGAHVGRYSVFPSRIIGVEGKVYSFEPVEDNYWQLKVTLALNRCENVNPINKAVSNKVGEAEINLFDKEFSSWSSFGEPEMISPDGRLLKPIKKQKVLCDTIDSFCSSNNIHKINFLKIDVEGFEFSVLEGANKMLQQKKIDFICFEISERPLKGAGVSSKQISRFLKEVGYNIFALQGPPYRFSGTIHDLECQHSNFYASYLDLRSKYL